MMHMQLGRAYQAQQSEFLRGLERLPSKVVHPRVFVVREHAVDRVKQLFDDELEKLLSHAAVVFTWNVRTNALINACVSARV